MELPPPEHYPDDGRRWVRLRLDKPYARNLFGIELLALDRGSVTLAVAFRDEFGFAPGIFQGAVTSALAEYAAAWAASSLMDKGWTNLTLEQTIHFTGLAEGQRLVAEGSVVSAGRTISISRSEVFAEKDGKRTLCAVMTQTNRHAMQR